MIMNPERRSPPGAPLSTAGDSHFVVRICNVAGTKHTPKHCVQAWGCIGNFQPALTKFTVGYIECWVGIWLAEFIHVRSSRYSVLHDIGHCSFRFVRNCSCWAEQKIHPSQAMAGVDLRLSNQCLLGRFRQLQSSSCCNLVTSSAELQPNMIRFAVPNLQAVVRGHHVAPPTQGRLAVVSRLAQMHKVHACNCLDNTQCHCATSW